MFVLNILCHNLLGTNRLEGWVRNYPNVGTKRLSLGANRLGTKRPWVRNDWIPIKLGSSVGCLRVPQVHFVRKQTMCKFNCLFCFLKAAQHCWQRGTCVQPPQMCTATEMMSATEMTPKHHRNDKQPILIKLPVMKFTHTRMTQISKKSWRCFFPGYQFSIQHPVYKIG